MGSRSRLNFRLYVIGRPFAAETRTLTRFQQPIQYSSLQYQQGTDPFVARLAVLTNVQKPQRLIGVSGGTRQPIKDIEASTRKS
jgi:hypothetical protein